MRFERIFLAGIIIIIGGVLFSSFTITSVVSSINVTPVGVLDSCDIGSGNKNIRVRGIFTENDPRLKEYRTVCEARNECGWTDLGRKEQKGQALELYACCANSKNAAGGSIDMTPRRCQLKFENTQK